MIDSVWKLTWLASRDDQTVLATVLASFDAVYRTQFDGDWLVNHDLPLEVRAFRRMDGWAVFLLLTPWMLARVFLPERAPALALPPGWRATERDRAPFTVLGPQLAFTILDGEQKAHLNYLPELGHFLLQPLVLSMQPYSSADAVFAAWNEVIRTRDRVMEEQQRECGWQQEVSRREFFARLGGMRSKQQ